MLPDKVLSKVKCSGNGSLFPFPLAKRHEHGSANQPSMLYAIFALWAIGELRIIKKKYNESKKLHLLCGQLSRYLLNVGPEHSK